LATPYGSRPILFEAKTLFLLDAMKSANVLTLSSDSPRPLEGSAIRPHLANRVRAEVKTFLRKYGLLLFFLGLWELSGRAHWVDQAIVPSLSTSIGAIVEMWRDIRLDLHIMVSLARVVIGLSIGLLAAGPLAFILGRLCPKFADSVDSLLRIFGLVNPYCLFPVFVVFFGLGEAPKIAVLAWVSLWPIFFNGQNAIRHVDPMLIKTARSMNCGSISIFFRVFLPATIPAFFTGVRIGVEMSFFILIAAEMTGATAGLGWIVHNAGATYQTARLYGAGICVVALGVLINRFLLVVRRGFLSWSEALSPAWLRAGRADRPIGRATAYIWLFSFILLLAFGFYQVFKAENLLLDQTLTPDYRVWSK
jgi:NitT/TauT family transport system permease protein